jgi:DNA uptake protein ComE-like DNA-binding protein
MWNEKPTEDYLEVTPTKIKLLTGQKAGGGESAVDSVMIHTCLLWSEAVLIFSEYLASTPEVCVRTAQSVNINRESAEECDVDRQLPHILYS